MRTPTRQGNNMIEGQPISVWAVNYAQAPAQITDTFVAGNNRCPINLLNEGSFFQASPVFTDRINSFLAMRLIIHTTHFWGLLSSPLSGISDRLFPMAFIIFSTAGMLLFPVCQIPPVKVRFLPLSIFLAPISRILPARFWVRCMSGACLDVTAGLTAWVYSFALRRKIVERLNLIADCTAFDHDAQDLIKVRRVVLAFYIRIFLSTLQRCFTFACLAFRAPFLPSLTAKVFKRFGLPTDTTLLHGTPHIVQLAVEIISHSKGGVPFSR
jgi:hypothetical protein